jgi:hypothetical protein
MSSFQIDANIPLPKEVRSGRYGKFKEAAAKMDVGDSVYCCSDRCKHGMIRALGRIGLISKSRIEGSGFRVWRVEDVKNTNT